MKITKVLFLFLLTFSVFSISIAQDKISINPSQNDVSPASKLNFSISKQVSTFSNLDAFGDLLRNYNVDSVTPGNAVSYGIVWTGSYFIVSQFNANKFYKISPSWVLLDSFAVTGSTGSFRDMAFAKGLLWGVNTTGSIFGVDTATKTVVKTITTSLTTLRALTWDPGRNGFWVGTNSFTGPMVCVDTNGVAIPGASIVTPASGLYSVGYDANPAGPYLWIGTDQAPTTATGTSFIRYNATTLARIDSIYVTVPLTTGAPLASGGMEVVTNLVPGKRTIVGLVQGTPDRVIVIDIGNSSTPPLSAFNLQTPAAGTRLVTAPGSTTPVTITWDTSATGATYKWIFGNPTTATRRLTLPSATNSITTTLGALDAILAANGFTNNGSATDSAVGQWDVWAFKGPGAPGADSLKSTNGPRAITLRRQQVTLSAFSLTSPATGTTVITSPVNSSPVTITWGSAGTGATYRWMFKIGASYSDPATFRVLSDNLGLGTSVTVRNSELDSILAGQGVAPGDSITGFWRVRAYSSSDSLNSTAPDRQITFRRVGLLPLAQDFESATFPPVFWTLDGTGTQYWTRATVSGYGTGTGSAKYDFWTAQTTTGAQTLTSNQFPPVIATQNFLRFNYAAAYYSATAIDSCVIETSTNAGTTWTRLTAMYQSTTLSSGVNSNPIMSTVSSTSQFTPTAGQWATKIYEMPVGTNKVRFVAKSAYGNNLYIDDITSGGSTGIGNSITLTPDKFELSQNYPNPFNPATKISFSIPKQSFVSLKVFDMLGREVAQIVNQELTPNVYSFDFNGANLSSGVYFYKLEAAGFSDVKRMMLIK
jgi:hypothetical protein